MANLNELIKQAYDIANIVPYNQTMSEDRFAEGWRLLKGNVARYTNDDLLCVYEDMVSVIPTNKELRIGDDVYCKIADTGTYVWLVLAHKADYDAVADKVTKSTSETYHEERLVLNGTAIFVQETQSWYYLNDGVMHSISNFEFSDGTLPESVNPNEYMPIWICTVAKVKSICIGEQILEFVPLTNWSQRYSYAWTQKDIGSCITILLEIPTLKEVTIVWNKSIDLDKAATEQVYDISIPPIYEQLLVFGLAVSLALKYPRQDDAQMTRLQSEYSNILSNCRTPLANRRMVWRSSSNGAYDLLSGRGLY